MTTNFKRGISSFGTVMNGLPDPSAGNVYHVCQSTNTHPYKRYVEMYGGTKYKDGSYALHTTIQSALDATVANRNDYVLVALDSSDYDITAALTMTKKGVHLLCPAGMHMGGIPSNACRIHQNTAALACITSTADCVEIAGFFFKGMIDSPIVTLSGSRWHNWVHHNFFGGAVTAGASIYLMHGDAASYQCSVTDNYMMGGYSPNAAQTISGIIGFDDASSGRNLIARNFVVSGAKITVTAGILTKGMTDVVCDNYIIETVDGSLGAGTFTEAWDGAVSTVYIGNRVAMDTPAESGGTADNTHVDNYSATDGGDAESIIEAS